jgi:hypothetical protein
MTKGREEARARVRGSKDYCITTRDAEPRSRFTPLSAKGRLYSYIGGVVLLSLSKPVP